MSNHPRCRPLFFYTFAVEINMTGVTRRKRRLTVFLNAQEAAELDKAAERDRRRVAEWARLALLDTARERLTPAGSQRDGKTRG